MTGTRRSQGGSPRAVSASALVLLAAAASLGVACDDERFVDQAIGVDAGNAGGRDAGGGDASSDAGGSGGADSGVTAVRTLSMRNPFGNTQVTGNLLVDGDFEFSGSDGQYGWIAFSSQGLAHETGGLCRSGVTCGRVTARQRLLAYAVAAPGAAMKLTLWTKPSNGDCSALAVYVIGVVSRDTPLFAEATATSSAPDAAGWCMLEATTGVVTEQPALYLENDNSGEVLIDDAVLLPSSAQARLVAPAVSSARRARITNTAEEARRRRRYGAAAPLKP